MTSRGGGASSSGRSSATPTLPRVARLLLRVQGAAADHGGACQGRVGRRCSGLSGVPRASRAVQDPDRPGPVLDLCDAGGGAGREVVHRAPRYCFGQRAQFAGRRAGSGQRSVRWSCRRSRLGPLVSVAALATGTRPRSGEHTAHPVCDCSRAKSRVRDGLCRVVRVATGLRAPCCPRTVRSRRPPRPSPCPGDPDLRRTRGARIPRWCRRRHP